MVLDALTNEKTGAIGSLSEVNAVGHRVVHGGEKFASSVIINDEVIDPQNMVWKPCPFPESARSHPLRHT